MVAQWITVIAAVLVVTCLAVSSSKTSEVIRELDSWKRRAV